MNTKPLISKEEEKKQTHNLETLRKKEEEEFAKKIAAELKLPYLDLSPASVREEALEILSQEAAESAEMAVIQKSRDTLGVAVRNPRNPETRRVIEDLRKRFGKILLYVVSDRSLRRAWSAYPAQKQRKKIAGSLEPSSALIEKLRKLIRKWDDLRNAMDSVTEKSASEILETMLAGALNLRASDLHVEPQNNGAALLRMRIDGIMHDISPLSQHNYALLLSRIKLLSEMKINVRDVAQDGRFSVVLRDGEIEVRSSVLPGEYGETIVLRVLDPGSLVSLQRLGLRKDLLDIVQKQIRKPHGLILSTGPTGSGKTTSLYAFLKTLAGPEVKTITIEDPIEYRLTYVSQTQVESKRDYTFATGLRAILRQDPNIILVGEIRDLETAETALHAALTGHLVFSTLHTNDAAGAIPRLLDMGANVSILGTALNMIIAQRLVRLLCAECRESYVPSEKEYDAVQHILDGFPASLQRPSFSKKSRLFRAMACASCNHTGYRGRTGIFEVLVATPELEKLILENPSISGLREFLQQNGVSTLAHDAALKVVNGETSIEEMSRVLG